jgi:hypothetical protein
MGWECVRQSERARERERDGAEGGSQLIALKPLCYCDKGRLSFNRERNDCKRATVHLSTHPLWSRGCEKVTPLN